MKIFTFKGGIHPPYEKDISISEPLREVPRPKISVVLLSQHIGAANKSIVNKGDIVEEGQRIGESDSFVSSPVHAPFAGKILDIKKAIHPAVGPGMSVFIETDPEKQKKQYEEKVPSKLTPQEIIEKVKSAGIVGMGGAAFPTHVKLSVPEEKKIKTLIINGAECEPYLTCDQSLMTRKTREILKGLELFMEVLHPEEIVIAIEDNKKAALFAFEKELKKISAESATKIRIIMLETKYPQGGEKQLIKAVSGKEVPPGGLPLDIGFLVQNIGTLYAVYEAVYKGKPLIERIVTISGDCLRRPGNYKIRVGTTVKDIIENAGIELYKDPKKILFGGPMMGFAQAQIEVPVLKSTSGILFLSEDKASVFEETPCIKCAKCVDVCPVRLIPTDIMKNVKKKKWENVESLHVSDCMECGACNYSCPARIPLVHYIKEGKAAIAKR